ncbi:MAG: winged helix-turn-helix domain-containing protein [Lachnospiraceae bacterium]|nr:winged helix-turn-helix domain-containing protein [Lachnospiraceae bacterium]
MDKNYNVVKTNLLEDLNNVMNGGDIQSIQQMANQFVRVVKEGVISQQYEQMHELLCSNQRQLEAWGNLLKLDASLMNYKIYVYAVYWTVERLAEELYQAQKKLRQIDEINIKIDQLRKSTHFYPLLQILAEKGEVSQGDIARYLNISSNALSNFLRRNEKYHLWQHEKYGKYNYYYLTNTGKQYYKASYSNNLMSKAPDMHTLTVLTLEAVLKELNVSDPNAENVFHYINEKLGSSQAVLGSEIEKAMVRKIFRRAEQKRREHENYYTDMLKYEEESQIYDLDREDYKIYDDFINQYAYI